MNLDRLYYALSLPFKCNEGCTDCCGPVVYTEEEERRILAHLKAQKRELPEQATVKCRFLIENRCSIYPVRPLLCRIYGLAEGVRCSHVTPAKLLSRDVEKRLMTEYARLPMSARSVVDAQRCLSRGGMPPSAEERR